MIGQNVKTNQNAYAIRLNLDFRYLGACGVPAILHEYSALNQNNWFTPSNWVKV